MHINRVFYTSMMCVVHRWVCKEKVVSKALLSELFGGRHRFELLRQLYLNPSRAFTVRELAQRAETDPGNTSRWLNRWATAGVVSRIEDGRNLFFKASANPLLAGLSEIMKRSDDMLNDIREALPPEAEVAVVFGSVARGEENAESDIDVLVLGEGLSDIRLNVLFKPISRQHHRVIHATSFSRQEFAQLLQERNSFALSVVSQKTIALKGELPHDLATAVHRLPDREASCSPQSRNFRTLRHPELIK
jgi:predicted nucleotidyltransferase